MKKIAILEHLSDEKKNNRHPFNNLLMNQFLKHLPMLPNSEESGGAKDVKFMKIYTVILIGAMTLALKVLAMFTLSMGTLIFESVIFINSWMPAHMVLVTGRILKAPPANPQTYICW